VRAVDSKGRRALSDTELDVTRAVAA
jgi:hypothetical protein